MNLRTFSPVRPSPAHPHYAAVDSRRPCPRQHPCVWGPGTGSVRCQVVREGEGAGWGRPWAASAPWVGWEAAGEASFLVAVAEDAYLKQQSE